MGLFGLLFKWSLQITGLSLVGYHYALKPNQQADLYGIYRAATNSYGAAKQIYSATNEYKQLSNIKQNKELYLKRLNEINKNTAQRIYTLSRTNQGVYMRLGQYLGHLKYAFPQQFTVILSKLNQNTNYQQRDYKYLKTHIQFALNKKTKQVFQSLNTIPIHTDLFHQIYKGQLLENFLDINLKVLNPYAKSQSKYDLIFIKKAIQYINNFKNKYYPQAQPLLLQLIYENLNKNVQKQLNLKLQEQNALKLKQTIQKIKSQNNTKLNIKNLPIYIPHIYQKYSHENLLIEQAAQGYRFNANNIQTIKKQKYPIKNIAADLTNYWNLMIQKNILLLNYSPFNLMIRKSRPNQQGSYQISPMNFQQSEVSQIFKHPYNILWKQLIVNKKLNIKNPQQRVNSIKQFYQNLPKVFINQLLNYQNCFNDLKAKVGLQNISQSNIKQIQLLSRQQINKQTSQKLIQKKLLTAASKKKQLISNQAKKQFNLLKKAFQIQYQPWNWQIMFNTYRQIFKHQQYFGAL